MDRQKIFWVVLSVSVFVVIVLVVGVVLLKQKPATTAQSPTVTSLSDTGAQVYEYQQSPSASTTQSGKNPGDTTQSTPFYVGESNGQQGTETGGGTPSDTGTAVGATTPSAASSAATPQPAATAARTASPKPAQTKPSAISSKPQRTVAYWIQTGSYKSPSKADELVTLLGNKGLTGRVFSTATDKSETFYRVRVGPYKNKGEAEKFLDIVKKVQGLEASYISQVSAMTPVN